MQTKKPMVLFSELKGVLSIELNRPEALNALNLECAEHISKQLQIWRKRLDSAKNHVYALVLRANETNSRSIWASGGDLKEHQTMSTKQAKLFISLMQQVALKIREFPVPTFALIDGRALGGAAELALFCDIRLATSVSSLSFPQIKLGLSTGFLGARRLVELIGVGRVAETLFLTKELSSEKALEWGLIHGLSADSAQLKKSLRSQLNHLEQLDIKALRAQKKLLLSASSVSYSKGEIKKDFSTFFALWKAEGHQRALNQFASRPRIQ